MKLLDDRHGSTMSEAEISPWPNLDMATTGDLLSARELVAQPGPWARLAARPAAPIGLSVGQVLAAHGALSDNWDGDGAIAPGVMAIRVAQSFVTELPTGATPSVSASVEGGVLLEWESQTVDLVLEIANSGAVDALVSWHSGSEVEGPLATVKQHVLDALAALLGQV